MNEPLRVSVVMTTYNGAVHLREQLDSLAAQTRPPDELVVCDDGSTDATPEILAAFAGAAGFPVRVHRNAVNLGADQNFSHALSLADGDVLFCCDQDDAWDAGKLAAVAAIFEASPEVGMVLNDAEVADDALRPTGATLWQSLGFTPARQDHLEEGAAFYELTKSVVAYGCAMAFRADLRDLYLPVPPTASFDHWIALCVAAVAPVRLVREPQQRYRQHARQVVGVRRLPMHRLVVSLLRRSGEDDGGRYLAQLEELDRRLRGRADSPELRRARAHLTGRLKFYRDRARLRRSLAWRGPLIAKNLLLGRYRTQGQGWKSAALDLLTRPRRLF